MLRSSIAVLLILSFISANLSRYFVYAGFEFNKSFIAATLCENKARPALQCNGKCYLSKQLQKDAEKEKSQDNAPKKSSFHEAFLTEKLVLTLPSQLIETRKATELPFVLTSHSAAIFHPPQA